jgi:ABC-type proline/glycine betaine transport system permease subunit
MLALDVGYSIAKLPQGAIFYLFLHVLGNGLVPTLDILVLYSILLVN